MTTTHTLKCAGRYYDAIARADKTFEVRFDDRAFQTGDILILQRIEHENMPPVQSRSTVDKPQPEMAVVVTFILHGGQWGIEKGWCVMGIKLK